VLIRGLVVQIVTFQPEANEVSKRVLH